MGVNALAVFHDHGCHVLDPLLKPGFRHVFCAVQDDNGYWIRFDAKAGIPDIDVVADRDFDLAEFWRGHDMTVVETSRGTKAPWLPFINANCVGLVKIVLCIRAPWVLTPYQLYKRLTVCQ